jgi:hypothetical protein
MGVLVFLFLEKIPCPTGYSPLTQEDYQKHAFVMW